METLLLTNRRKVCRTCLRIVESRKNLTSIYTPDPAIPNMKISYSDMLRLVTNEILPPFDELPKRICDVCILQIRSSFQFRVNAETSYQTLIKTFGIASVQAIEGQVKAEKIPDLPIVETESNEQFEQQTIPVSQDNYDEFLEEIAAPTYSNYMPSTSNAQSNQNHEHYMNNCVNEEEEEEEDGLIQEAARDDKGRSPDSGFTEDADNELFKKGQEEAFNAMDDSEKYICEFCNKPMFGLQALHRHKKNFHTGKKCSYCVKKIAPSSIEMENHILDRHPDRYEEYKENCRQLKPAEVVIEPTEISNYHACTSCDRIFLNKIAYLKHDFECVHGCDECNLDFVDQNVFKEHFAEIHKIEFEKKAAVVNSTSSVKTYSKQEFYDKFVAKQKDTFFCKPCNSQTVSILNHLYKHSTKPSFQCPFCPKMFYARNVRHLHMQQKHPQGYRCEFCKKQFTKHAILTKHSMSAHRKPSLVKKGKFETADPASENLRYVEIRHKPFGREKSQPMLTIEEDSQDSSMSQPTQIQPQNVVSYSFKEFKDKFLERQANGADTYCKICKMCSLTKNITTHCKTRHALTMPFLCYLCDKRFTYTAARTTHMQRKHPDSFICSKCNQQFLQPSALAEHMKIAHFMNIKIAGAPKELDVNLHDMRFTSNLPTEQYVDEQGDCEIVAVAPAVAAAAPKPKQQNLFYRDEFIKKFFIDKKHFFDCTVCNKKFNKTSASSHLIHFHSIELPFKCPFCERRFSETRTRNKHALSQHEGYKCLFCTMRFPDHSGVLLHTRHAHKMSKVVSRSPQEEVDLIGNNIMYAVNPSRRQVTAVEGSDEENEMMQVDESSQNGMEIAEEEGDVDEGYSEMEFIKKFIVQMNKDKIKCNPCDKEFLKGSLASHMKEVHSKTPPFVCELCPEEFNKYHHRPIHMKEFHPDAFRCEHCNKQFNHTIGFRKHMSNQHQVTIDIEPMKPIEEIEVPMENLEFVRNPSRSIQLKKSYVAESGLEVKRTQSIEEFTLERFKNNFISHISDGNILCHVCIVQVAEKNFKIHMLENHATTEYTFCEVCGKGFNSELKRLRHMCDKHPNDLKCMSCRSQFTKAALYTQHMRIQHKIPNFIAPPLKFRRDDIPFDNVLFTDHTPKLRKMHYYQMFADVADDIPMTRAQFTTKFVRVHADNNLQTRCLACGKDILESSRREHLDSKHAIIKPHACDFCQRRFHQKFFLRKHIEKKHPNQYFCHLCNLQMLKGQEYVDHMRNLHGQIIDIDIPKDTDISNSDLRYARNVDAWKMREEIQSTVSSDIADIIESLNDFQEDGVLSCFNCSQCNLEFDSSRMLRNHKRIDCPYQPTTSMSDNNSVVSEEQDEFSCEKCDRKFNSKNSIARHRTWHLKYDDKITTENNVSIDRSFEQMKAPSPSPVKIKSTEPEYECDVCDEVGTKRDQMEKHMKAFHPGEFKCGLCPTLSSTYILSKTHLLSRHPRMVKSEINNRHKCPQCFRYFNVMESLNDHVKFKHGKAKDRTDTFYCEACNYVAYDRFSYAKHCEHWHHRNQDELMKNEKARMVTGEDETFELDQSVDTVANSVEKPSFKLPSRRMSLFPQEKAAPMTVIEAIGAMRKRRMSVMPSSSFVKDLMRKDQLESKVEEKNAVLPVPIKKEKLDDDEVLVKFAMPATSTHDNPPKSESPKDSNSDEASSSGSGETRDETVYLKRMVYENGVFKCLICEKTKPLRKFMLHHLKQHGEIPTYACTQCPEKFLFKAKYEHHLKSHETADEPMADLICVDEHPKFQNPSSTPNIRCEICKMSFKLCIMLNRHNTDWHADTNPDRELTIREQRLKRRQIKEEAQNKNIIQVTQIEEPNEQ